jgi:hypothetical protein
MDSYYQTNKSEEILALSSFSCHCCFLVQFDVQGAIEPFYEESSDFSFSFLFV